MKLLLTVSVCVLAFGLINCAEPSAEYLPPAQEVSQEYIPPAVEEPEPAAILADDGYRYKAVKRLKFRHRRDVSELANEYLPPVQEQEVAAEQDIVQAAPEPEPAHELASDGYRYKTVKRYRYRIRRDVSELNNEYLPPNQEVSQEYLPPAHEEAPVPEPAHELASDGYRYKAVKRYRFRHRRDVSELNNEYLPPNQEQAVEVVQEAAPAPIVAPEPEPAHELASDGYRYKTVKRYRFRHRRDVSELNNEYLPPNQEQAVEVVQEAAPAPVAAPEPEPAHELASDGYRYKTVKRYRFRHRRDVSELNSEYLPPNQEVSQEYLPPAQEVAESVVEAAPAHDLASDGYRYKSVKRYRFRHRRDVSELNNEYLPPNQEGAVEVVQEAAPAPVAAPEPEPAHELASDGYRYKTVKRYRFRHRRDVSELNNEYLPPNSAEVVEETAPAPVEIVEPEPAHELASDGYRYKTVKRYRFRHRRDVSELNNEYLPPNSVEVVQEAAPAPVEVVEPEPAHELASDGYRYKTVKRYRFRHRRDVSELNSEYLPPNQEVSQEYLPPAQEAAPVAEPEPAHELANDGYRYKSRRRVVYRRRS